MYEEGEDNAKHYKTACEVLDEMLQELPGIRVEVEGGRDSIGFNTDGQVSFSRLEPTVRFDYGRDTNALVRAKYACERGMVVSPASRKHTLFIRPDDVKTHLAMAEERARKREEQLAQELAEQLEDKKRCSVM